MNDKQFAALKKEVTTLVAAKSQKPKANKPKPARVDRSRTVAASNASAPTAFSSGMRRRNEAGINHKGTTTYVSNIEYIFPLQGGSAVAINSYNGTSYGRLGINPGNSLLFPWLSSIAANYEQYFFKKLIFHYRSYMPSSESGKFALAVDYDASDGIPGTIQDVSVQPDVADDNVWKSFSLACKGEYMGVPYKFRYVRPGAQPSNTDIKLYDIGNLIIAAYGVGSTRNIGDLWVEYEVEFKMPSISGALNAYSYVSTPSPIGTSNSPNLFNLVGQINNFLGSVLQPATTAATKTVQFNALGQYLVDLFVTGTTLVGGTWNTPLGCTVLSNSTDTSAAATSVTSWAEVLVTTLPASIILPITSYATLASLNLHAGPIAKGF